MKKTHMTVLAGGLGLILALAVLAGLGSRAGAVEAADASQTSGGFITVTVQLGDNLGKYARLYGTSGAAMLAVNKIPDPNLIFPGQIITIPVIRTFTPSLTTPFFYTVQAGDTLTTIGREFEMDPSTIANANGITNGIVVVGKTYLIPAGPHLHFVAAGETLRTIAAKHGTTVSFLLAGNNLPNPDLIYVGQPIYIPILFDAQPVPLSGAPTPVATATRTGTAVTTPSATGTKAPTATPIPSTATPGPTATATPLSAGNFILVTVREGESLLTYVYRYGLTGSAIRLANPQLADPNLLFPGDQLIIPIAISFTPSRTTPFFYVVLPGDTPTGIASKFELDLEVLTAANPGASFAAGSSVLIPAGPHLYTTRTGDTLASIAAKFGTTSDVLLSFNTIPNPNQIFAGQQLYIPTKYNGTPLPYD